MPRKSARDVVLLGLMVGMALALHIFEGLLPLPFLFPGAKLGLANIVGLFVLVHFGFSQAVLVTLLRVLLGSLLSGTLLTLTFYLGLAGGMVSIIGMGTSYSLFSTRFSLLGLSMQGAILHNVAQVLTASLLVGTLGIFFYLPYLLLFSIPTGLFVGAVTKEMVKHAARSSF